MRNRKSFYREDIESICFRDLPIDRQQTAYYRDIRQLQAHMETALSHTAPENRPAHTPAIAALYAAWAGFRTGELCAIQKADVVPGGLLRGGQLCSLPEFAMEPLRCCRDEGQSSALLFPASGSEEWLTEQVSRLNLLAGEDSPLTFPVVYQSGLFHRLYIAEWVDRTLDLEHGDEPTLSQVFQEDLSDPEKRMARLAEYRRYRELFLPEPPQNPPRLRVQTFGNFGVFWEGLPVHFHRSRTKELFAYLIDRRGVGCTMGELLPILWEGRPDTDGLRSQLRSLIADLRTTLEGLGEGAVVVKQRNLIAVNPALVDCDYYRFLAGEPGAVNAFRGEYMTNYSWAEPTLGALTQRK